MATEGLEIDITVKADGAAKEIKKITDALGGIDDQSGVIEQLDARIKKLGADLKTANPPAQLGKIVVELERTKSALNSIKTGTFTSGLNSATKSITGTNTALVNFGRVVQDAPFGLIGIANNIDPLLQSFQNLKKETGSAGGAFKALAAGLVGPTGIAIAVSAVTSAFIAFGPQIMNFINGVKTLSEAEKAAAKDQKDFADSLNNARASALSYGIEVKGLINLYNSENTTSKEREILLKKINDQLKEYGVVVTAADVASGKAAEAVNTLTNALVAQAVAAKLADRVADLYIKQADAITIYSKAQVKLKAETDALNIAAEKNLKIQENAAKRGSEFTGQRVDISKQKDATKELTVATTNYKQVTQELKDVTTFFNTELAKTIGLVKPVKDGTDGLSKSSKATPKIKAQKDEIEKAAKANNDFAISIAGIIKLNAELTGQDEYKESISGRILQAEKDLQAILKMKLTDYEKLIALKQQEILLDQKAKISGTISGQPQSAGANILQQKKPVTLGTEAAELAIVNGNLTAMQEKLANVQAAFTLVGGAIDQAFNALANGQDPTEALKQSLKQLIVQLAKAAALALILSAVSGGAAGAGINGLKGFKAIFGSLLGFKASGGGMQGGNAFMVGENGPEMFVPGANGAMVNNNALRGAGGGAVSFEIRGDVLFGLLRKNGQNRYANFG